MSTTTQPEKPSKKEWGSARDIFAVQWSRYGAVVIFAVIVFVFYLVTPSFLSPGNVPRIFEQSTVHTLLAFGEFFAIIIAGIDLSVGSMMALSGVFVAQLMNSGMGWIPAILIGGIGGGALLGFFNGALTAVTKLHPFIITLGTLAGYRGLTYVFSDARSVSGLDPALTRVVAGKTGVVPNPVIITLVLLVVLIIFARHTKYGHNLYAIGGNRDAAWYAGISIGWHTVLAFTVCGIFAGMAGIVNVARLGAAEPNAGTTYEVFAIAAVIIAGTSFFGGKGSIWKVLIGGLIIGVIQNGLNFAGVSSYYQQVAMGGLIIVAVTLDRFFGPRSISGN